MPNKTYLVLTTINTPIVAEKFYQNFKKFGHLKETGLIIIGDTKSPVKKSLSVINKLNKKGFDVEYFDVKRQKDWLKKFPKFSKIIPYNSDNRRNIGFLIALEKTPELLISIDDDNFPQNSSDFLKGHTIAGKTQELNIIRSNSGWFNVCDLLENNTKTTIYPRGFPYNKRNLIGKTTKTKKKVKIGMNIGLWLNDPDIDAITRINNDVKITKYNSKQIGLELGTFTPINTQNTAIIPYLLPAYYFVIMGERIDGLTIDRYGDIWSGLFVKKVMDHLGYYVSIGEPIAIHIRNRHVLFDDLKQELMAIIYTDLLSEIVMNINLRGKSPIDAYDSLTDQLLKYSKKDTRFSRDFKRYQAKIHYCQKIWLDTIAKIQC